MTQTQTKVNEADVITELLESYRGFPCLWDNSDPQYMNRDSRQVAYAVLLDIFKKSQPDASMEMLKKRLENLRTCYKRERKKMEDSMGGTGSYLYTSKLWYYDLLTFLDEKEADRGATESGFLTDDESDRQFFKVPLPKKKRTKEEKDLSQFIQTCTAALSTPSSISDDCSAFGAYVSEKLRKMEGSQQILAEALIQKVITKGMKKQLTDNTDLLETSPSMHLRVLTTRS